jgi:ribonuclease E
MSKEIYISSTPHETRLAIVENDALTEIYYERENEYTLAGSIYNGKVTRVLPGMQSSFVDIGLERDAFLYITDFMEEAGDSADFDTSGTDSGSRSEGRRNGRDRNSSPSTIEGSVSTASEPSADSENRTSERSDRGDRGERGRSRGRRDRGGNRDRQPLPENVAPTGEAEFTRTPDPVAREASAVKEDDAELGEGAPGADGSRRWRGRRGRRRGRGPGQRDESPQLAGGSVDSPQEGHSQTADDDSFDIDAAAAPNFTTSTTAPASSAASTTEATSFAQENVSRGERDDRNRRGERNDRGGRGDRGGRDQRGPRVPRGFAPKTSLYGVDDSPAYGQSPESDASAAEPIILPGESLSKYRKGGDEPTASPSAAHGAAEQNVILPAAPSFAIPAGWDGGATLPGESLSRHSRSEGRAEHREESRSSYRNNPEPALPRAQVIHEAEGVSVAETIEEQPEVLQAAHPDLVSPGQLEYEPVVAAQPQTAAIPASPSTPEPAVAAEPAEYEPVDGSASYRVDPAAPSEYRQSAPVLDPPQEESHGDREPQEHSETHSITPGPGESMAPLQVEAPAVHAAAAPAVERFDWQTDPTPQASETATEAAAEPHQLTSLNATGELYSEPPTATFIPGQATESVSPIEQEAAIATPAAEAGTHGLATPHFAPGAGPVEEEVFEEEDFDTTLHASSIEEMDDFDEEETLEGAADLGTMIREMSIDQITRSGNVDEEQEEEDDLEEEDAIYDPNHTSDTEEDEDLDEADSEEDVIHEEFAEGSEAGANDFNQAQPGAATPAPNRNQDRGRGRRDGRRDGRRGERFGSGDRSERPRHTGGAGDRERSGGGRDRRGGRSSMQSTNLPAISELLKPGQEILVQIAKEPIAKKGARITSHIALPGRFLVFMPTVNHTGVSRKIESDGERRRLKEILLSEKGEASGGFIVRTAASGASEEELRSDLRFLLNLWADIKQRSESSKSPALIYHDLNLVERILRDQVTDNFSAIWVDNEGEYERVLRFLQRFQPSLIRRVKLYTKETPLFEQFGITEEINKALRSKVWLKSGGSIVINQTEALVAIDINTGKFVGKTARLEDTIVKTNLDAIPEIVRQIRLRDLGGIIIIDFIDMDERKNRNRVMAALEEELKNDRAPSKVLQFNDFGLVAITRKRVKQSLERTLSTTCNVCVGTGMVKSPVTVCNDIYIEMRKMQKHLDRGDVMLRVNPEVVKQLKAPGTKWLQEMEETVGKTILVKSDPSLHPEQFDIH